MKPKTTQHAEWTAPKPDIAKISLNDKVGSEEALKTEFLGFVSHVINHGVRKVLVHNHELNHHISQGMQQWALMNLELPLLQSGVDKIAMVMPNDESIMSLIPKSDTRRKRYFKTEQDALSWLESA